MRTALTACVVLAAGLCLGAAADWVTRQEFSELQKRVRELEKQVHLVRWKLKSPSARQADQTEPDRTQSIDVNQLKPRHVYKIEKDVPLLKYPTPPKTLDDAAAAIETLQKAKGGSYIMVSRRRPMPHVGQIWYKVYAHYSPSGSPGEHIDYPGGQGFWMWPDDAEHTQGWVRAEALRHQHLQHAGVRPR